MLRGLGIYPAVALEWKTYGAGRTDTGVAAYAVTEDGLLVQFRSGETYEYDTVRPGRLHMQAMVELAHRGRGLSTYISQHVGGNYRKKGRSSGDANSLS